MTTDIYHDKVERLRKKIEKVTIEENENAEYESRSLPSRSEIHHNKRNKKKNKIKFPLLKALLVFFILLPVVIISAYTYFSGKGSKANTVVVKNTGEEISYDKTGINEVQQEKVENTDSQIQNDQTQSETSNPEESQIDFENIKTSNAEIEGTNENTTSEKNSDQNQTSTNNGKTIYHTVQPNETLFSIAMKYYQSKNGIDVIKQWNQLNNNEIVVGQVLEIYLKN